ncbi:DUF4136 domain-containing protein [Flavihumibacter stibioxidans]|uniref:DUF4136 domain-containing protein n=1 Tax=Flavihumibacter stibioxidans TaxID=1834163 RepID=A0ABR7MDE3_9BACT|nr:DUF4136 domain-containing protein [Flavihumibacter stibioxidans]MBC6492854.1 hypothetical protein [Flavihumibacter stibioxidans]
MNKFAGLILVLFLLACTTGNKIVHSKVDQAASWTTYKTFRFLDLDASGDTLSADFYNRIGMLKDAITEELNKAGLVNTDQNPDLLVNIGIVVKKETQTRTADFRFDGPRYMGQRNYTWKAEEIPVGIYRLGTAEIHLVDARTSSLVWDGAIQGILPEKPSKARQAIHEGMTELFTKVPLPKQ